MKLTPYRYPLTAWDLPHRPKDLAPHQRRSVLPQQNRHIRTLPRSPSGSPKPGGHTAVLPVPLPLTRLEGPRSHTGAVRGFPEDLPLLWESGGFGGRDMEVGGEDEGRGCGSEGTGSRGCGARFLGEQLRRFCLSRVRGMSHAGLADGRCSIATGAPRGWKTDSILVEQRRQEIRLQGGPTLVGGNSRDEPGCRIGFTDGQGSRSDERTRLNEGSIGPGIGRRSG